MDRCKTKWIGVSRSESGVACLGTYTRWLVHIDPGAINVQTGGRVIEELELIVPIILCLWIEPI